ncbi:hypothetical protein FQN50_002913 [Emmonsiellopsis sp. PD_5]|nr:hypothetical protein FQN50_002913 [Emmonsiellopsis sp. PD_5]
MVGMSPRRVKSGLRPRAAGKVTKARATRRTPNIPPPSTRRATREAHEAFRHSIPDHPTGHAMGTAASQPAEPSLPIKRTTRSNRKARTDAYRECFICAEKKPLGRNGANFPAFPGCDHDSLTCLDCVAKHTIITLKTRAPVNHNRAKKDSIDWSVCTCPHCNTSLSEADIRSALNRVENLIISEIVARKTQESHPRWTWCLSVTCSSGQIFPEQSRSQKVTCTKCGAHSCFFHGVPWHERLSCSQFDDTRPDAKSIRSSEDRIKRTTKVCPTAGCGWRIQKDGGCPSMYCTLWPLLHSFVLVSTRPVPVFLNSSIAQSQSINKSTLGPKCNRGFYWTDVKYDDNVTPDPE